MADTSNARDRDRISVDPRVSTTVASSEYHRVQDDNAVLPRTHFFLAVAASARGTHGAVRRASPAYSLRALEIRLRRGRDVGVRFVILLDVFRADDFRPVVGAAPIGDGPGPWCREHALIFDREVDLEVLASRSRRTRRAPVLLCVAGQAFLSVFEVDQPIALQHMQLLGGGRAEK